jgi:hypothetical protein
MEHPATDDSDGNRTKAVLAILPFVALGVADVILLLFWGLDPLWGFMILPPIIAISILGYIGFKHGFIQNAGDGRGDEDRDFGDGRDVGNGHDFGDGPSEDARGTSRRN